MRHLLLMLLTFFGEWNEAEEIAAGQAMLAVVQVAMSPKLVHSEPDKVYRKAQCLVFTATWCSPCVGYKKTIDRLKANQFVVEEWGHGKPAHIYMVDTDQFSKLSKKYRIDQLPTTVLLLDGVESDRRVGALTRTGLLDLYHGR